MGLAPKQRDRLTTRKQVVRCFGAIPVDRHFGPLRARSQSPFFARVFGLSNHALNSRRTVRACWSSRVLSRLLVMTVAETGVVRPRHRGQELLRSPPEPPAIAEKHREVPCRRIARRSKLL